MMSKVTRRQFAAGLAAMPLLAGSWRYASAQGLPDTYAGTTLRMLAGAGGVWDSMIASYKEFTDATGIRVETTGLPYSDQYQKMILDMASKSGSFDLYVYAYQWKYELERVLADLGSIPTEIPGAPDLALDDYPPRVLDIYGKIDGKLVGLPVIGDVTLFVWNKDHYAAAGLDPAKPPTTWEEVYTYGQKLQGGDVYGYGMPAGKSIQTAVTWILVFKALGGEYFDAAWNPQFDSPAGVETMKFLVDKLQQVAPPGNLTWDFPEMLNSLITGQSAQSMMWPGGFGVLLDPTESAVAGSVAWSPTPEVSLLGGWSVGVNNRSPSQEAAKLFVAWMTSKELWQKGALQGWAPTRISILKDPAVLERNPAAPAVLAGLEGNVAEYPPVKQAEQIHIMIYDEVNAAAAKVKSPEQAAADLQEKVTAFMKKKGYIE
jgi:multiple sugar transport system substrate-binding protein